MDRVTYILGAGFSAPAGLPVMSNFISMAKDLYFKGNKKYSYFQKVFSKIDRMSKIKNILNSDLSNIEEVLSILETERQIIRETAINRQFVSLIADVVNHYTPPLEDFAPNFPGNWNRFVFGNKEPEKFYNAFFSSLFKIEYTVKRDEDPVCTASLNKKDANYSIVTLNYDLLPERFEESISKYYRSDGSIVFKRSGHNSKPLTPSLAKIHGSSDTEDIIPPTWAKTSNKNLKRSWKLARESISSANHIRIIGYSMPISDSYIKYILKVALMRNKHLKSIDVISLDPYGDVQQRYEKFIDFSNFKFFNVNTIDYLRLFSINYKFDSSADILISNRAESAHTDFLNKYA